MKTRYLAVKDNEENVLGIITYSEDNASTFAERMVSCLEDNSFSNVTLTKDEEAELVSAVTGYGEQEFTFSTTDEDGEAECETVYITSVSVY